MVISPIQFLFGWFGYAKIPMEVVQLSMCQEEAFRIIIKRLEENGCVAKGCRKALEAQRSITAFLRSGRVLQ